MPQYAWDGALWRAYGGVNPDVDPFILGTTKPDETNVGLFRPTTSVVSTADFVASTPGQTFVDVRFDGNVSVQAPNVKFYNCHFRGKMATGGHHIVRTNHAGHTGGAYFERCLFDNRWFPSTNAADGAHGGIMCRDTTLVRCEIRHATDGVGIVGGGNVTMLGCWIHSLWYFSPDSYHMKDGTHADGMESHPQESKSNIIIRGCRIEGLVDHTLPNAQSGIPPTFDGNGDLIGGYAYYHTHFDEWNGKYDAPPWGTSALLFSRSGTNTLTDVVIDSNWLSGGWLAVINISPGFTDAYASGIEITNNRIGNVTRDRHSSGLPYLVICSTSLQNGITISGNVMEHDGTPNNLRRTG